MKTITLTEKLTFIEALNALKEGKCFGIKPGVNTSFLVNYKPKWMNEESNDFMLKWYFTENDTCIRSNQFLEEWYLVIIDHRELDKIIK